MIEYQVLTDSEEIAVVAATLDDTSEPTTHGGALVRRGTAHGVDTLIIDLGGTMFVIA